MHFAFRNITRAAFPAVPLAGVTDPEFKRSSNTPTHQEHCNENE